jgi:transcriptional regulator with XRE-family HTH domain
MQERSLSQRAVAEMCGVQVSVVNGWTAGALPADPQAVLRLCKALGLDFQQMLTGEFSNFAPKDLKMEDLFETQTEPAFSGLFQIEAKRLRRRTG